MSLTSLMQKTADVQRALPAVKTFSTGGAKNWVTIYADVRCEIQPRSGDTEVAIGAETAFATHRMYCLPSDVEGVREGDRILHESDYYGIVGVRDIDEWHRLATFDLMQVKGRVID